MSELSAIVKERVWKALGHELSDEDAEEIRRTIIAAGVDVDLALSTFAHYMDTPDLDKFRADIEATVNGR